MSNSEYYESLVNAGMNTSQAAQSVDWQIAYRYAKRRLAKKNIRREPTEREVNAILQNM